MENWIDVNDRLPENGADVLIVVFDLPFNRSSIFKVRYYDGQFKIICDPSESTTVTHWMELPELPK